MRFRLTYEGELKPTQRDPTDSQATPDRLAAHKQMVRRSFHGQLKQLWATNRFLREHKVDPAANPWARHIPSGGAEWGPDPDQLRPMAEVIAQGYQFNGFRYVPLVREELSLLCTINVIFLRRDIPGSVIIAGDIDNRIKTLIDCLRIPKKKSEFHENEVPRSDENPFFVLMDYDKLVTGLTVETDTLLDAPNSSDNADQRRVKLMITVEIKPYDVTMLNLSFS